jgi:ABC-type transporter Mla subunit MlaD
MAESSKNFSKFKAGIFIIFTLSLLIFSILWLRYFSITPKMKITAQFINPGPITDGFQVFYRGVNIGKVSKVEYSDDFKKTLVKIEIYRGDLNIPANAFAEVKMEGIAGQKYIDIIYPKKPSRYVLQDGSVIRGKSQFGLEELGYFFEEAIESGRLDRIFSNFEETLKNTNELTLKLKETSDVLNQMINNNKNDVETLLNEGAKAARDFSDVSGGIKNIITDKKFIKDIRGSAENINKTTIGINRFIGDAELQKSIKDTFGSLGRITDRADKTLGVIDSSTDLRTDTAQAVSNLGSLFNSTDKLVQHWDYYSSELYKDVKRSNLIENVSCAFAQAGITLDEANKILNELEAEGIDEDVRKLIISTLQNTNQAAMRVDCVGKGVSDMLNQRFLLLRLLFGNPGSKLEECEKHSRKNTCPLNKQP